MLLCYIDVWRKRFEGVLEARRKAGKRAMPRKPPLHLLVRALSVNESTGAKVYNRSLT